MTRLEMTQTVARWANAQRRAKGRRAAGVTLVEVLIVVAIMAMLAGLVSFAVLPQLDKASKDTARQNAIAIRKAAQLWQMDNGTDCPSVSQLKKDKYLDKVGNTEDPWGKAFKIKCADSEIYVASSGPDKKRNTEDDIQVPSESEDEDE